MTEPSALEKLVQTIQPSIDHTDLMQALAIEVKHNLQHQHDWKDLEIHYTSKVDSKPLARPLVTGIPPRRVYIHPDEQIQLIKAGIKDEDLPGQREWVLPSRLREKWTLRQFAEVFDGITAIPPGDEEQVTDVAGSNKWRQMKRLLLATVDDDSTITYYIVHDGIVKPRQN